MRRAVPRAVPLLFLGALAGGSFFLPRDITVPMMYASGDAADVTQNGGYTLGARVTYMDSSGQYIEFEGADSAWLSIDGEMALELAGVGANTTQRILLDRLGLTDGQTYDLQLRYVQRDASLDAFEFRTNLVPLPTSP